MDLAGIDDNLEFFRQTVVPEMRTRPGFLAVRHLIDRDTGQGRVGSVWADQASLAASLAQSERRRARAMDRGVEFGEDRVLDVLFTAMGPRSDAVAAARSSFSAASNWRR
jgi:hypothetical protein